MIQLPPGFDPFLFVSDIYYIVLQLLPVFVLISVAGLVIKIFKRANP